MSFLQELLHVPGGRPAGARLKHSTAFKQGDDREHLGAGAQFQDREEIGQIITQHVAGHRNSVLALPAPLHRELYGINGSHGADVQPGRVMGGQILVDFFDQLRVVSPVRVQPKDGWRAGDSGPIDPKPYPVFNRGVFGLAHPKDVGFLNALLHQGRAGCVHNANRPVAGGFKGLVVRNRILSAAWAISPTLATLPMVDGSNAPCSWQSSIAAWYRVE